MIELYNNTRPARAVIVGMVVVLSLLCLRDTKFQVFFLTATCRVQLPAAADASLSWLASDAGGPLAVGSLG